MFKRAAMGLLLLFLFTGQGKPPPPIPITLTQVRPLQFGLCDAIAGATYTVDPADVQLPTACPGAFSAKYQVDGTPNTNVTITTDASILITNGADTLTVTLNQSPRQSVRKLDGAGQLFIWVGGTVTLPAGNLASFNDLLGTSAITVVY